MRKVIPQIPDYIGWIRLEVLPFWAAAGISAQTGLFHERLLSDGTADPHARLRTRTQLRQIYVLSHAASLGWLPEGADIARNVWAKLLPVAYKIDGHGGFIQTLSCDGIADDLRRDSYDHAFAILAAAWLAHASGDAHIRQTLQELLEFVDLDLTDANGALREGKPDSLPYRQNPQMHWFESMLALIETSAHESGPLRATNHRNFFENKLIEAKSAVLSEYFTADWRPVPGKIGDVVEPGHLMEWVWLLRKHETLTGLPRSNLPSHILHTANRYLDPALDLLVDEALRDGTIVRASRRVWLQTELIKANLAEFEAGDNAALAKVLVGIERLTHHYLRKPFAQGWLDQLDADGSPLITTVSASILYHLFVLAAELDRVLGKPEIREHLAVVSDTG